MKINLNRLSVKLKSISTLQILIIVFLIALSLRVAVLFTNPHNIADHWDVSHYVVIARNLADGNGFANEPGHPTAFRFPLLPPVLSLFFRIFRERSLVFGQWYIPFLFFQSILGALIAPITAWIGHEIKGKTLALLAGMLVAVNTELISYSRMMLPETIFSFLLCLIALLCIYLIPGKRRILTFAGGILLGLAVLCRPVAIGWGILLAVIFMFRKEYKLRARINLILLLAAGGIVTVAPWLIRNQIVMSSPVFSTSSGIAFWLYGHNDAARADGDTHIPEEYIKVNEMVRPREYHMQEGGDPAQMIPIYNMEPGYEAYGFERSVVDRLEGLEEIEANQEFNSMAWEYIWANPFETLTHSISSLFQTVAYAEMDGKINIQLTLIMPFILLGMYWLWKHSRHIALIILACLLSMLAVHFLFYFDHRFRVPYLPFLALLGAAGFLTAINGNLIRTEKNFFFGWMVVPVVVNYFLLWGNTTG